MREERELSAPAVQEEPQQKATPATPYLVERAIVARNELLQAEFQREAKQAARIAALEAELAEARDKALEEAAAAALAHEWFRNIEWWMETPKTGVSREAAEECATAIRALKTANETRTKAGE